MCLPPIVPQPLARHRGHIGRETRLQSPVEVEVRPIRQPIEAILVESRRQVRGQGQLLGRLGTVGVELLVRVMDAFVRAAGQDFDVGFLGVILVKEWARYGSGDGADLHRCAHAAVQNGVFFGVDLGA